MQIIKNCSFVFRVGHTFSPVRKYGITVMKNTFLPQAALPLCPCCGARCTPWRFPPASHTDRGHCARSLHLPQAALPSLPLKNPPPLTGFCSKRGNFQRGFQRGKHRKTKFFSLFVCFPLWSSEESGERTKSSPAALCILSRR